MARRATARVQKFPTTPGNPHQIFKIEGSIYTFEFFDAVVMNTRMYFRDAYEGGTREMIRRYVNKKIGYVPPQMISAALKIMKKEGGILYEAKVWWDVGAM